MDDNLIYGRKPGSGLSGDTATAVEELVAAYVRGDDTAVKRQEAVLKRERNRGHCGVDQRRLSAWVKELTAQLNVAAATARRAMPGSPGDVEIVLRDGNSIWLEVKAQTAKARFADITQADWVRDGTDALAWMTHFDPGFRKQAGREVSSGLAAFASLASFDGWTLRDLWLADVALITSAADRHAVGVPDPASLEAFLRRKYVLHITQEGARLGLLGELDGIAAVIAGASPSFSRKQNRSSVVSVQVTVPGIGVVFTYHLYETGTAGHLRGRHKLHARCFGTGEHLTSVAD